MRLRKSWEFNKVKKNGKKFRGKSFWFQITFCKGSTDLPKLGIIASKRYGGAVMRNHAKRKLREVFRKNLSELPLGSKIVIMPRPYLSLTPFSELEKTFLSALAKTSLT